VGIGASAGGLEAIKLFLKGVPEKSGMAYVYVQHLSPHHEGALTEFLCREAKIPVMEVTDDRFLPNLLTHKSTQKKVISQRL
jgi:two-component system CheB/CheR fusion protein